MFEMLVGSATAGFGASIGRDLYKSAKKNPFIWAVIGALLLVFGWRNAFLGYGRSGAYFVFVTVIGSTIMILFGGVMLATFSHVFALSFLGNNAVLAGVISGGSVLVSSVVGIFWGKSARAARIRTNEVAVLNYLFLDEHGFTESEFESDQMIDSEGHTLKVIEQTTDKIVFSVVGRRGLRAAIKLVDGEMVSYTGVQKAA